MVHADSYRINISIADIHILATRILDVGNSFHNKNSSIHKIVGFSSSPYYLEWFERSYPNGTLNRYEGPFFLQCMNRMQVTKPSRGQCNILLYAVVTVIKYNNITIDRAIYIKVLSGGTVHYITVSNDDVINTNNNETVFT